MFTVEIYQDQITPLLDKKVFDPRSWDRFGEYISERVGSEYVRLLKIAINQNKALGPPLSEAWARRKGHSKKWQNWFDLKENIQKVKMPGGGIGVGVPTGRTNREGDQLDLIAQFLEEGTFNIQPRPLFGPTAQKLMKDKKFFNGVVRGAMAKELGLV